jgi:hypothetical protein
VFFLSRARPWVTQGTSSLPPWAQVATSFAPMSMVTKATLLRLALRYFSAAASCEVPALLFL